MTNRVCELLGITHPIIQAPMAGVTTVALAAAASNAGAIGTLAFGAMNAAQGRAQLLEMREATRQPYCLNFFCHQPAKKDTQRETKWLNYLAPFFAEFDALPPTELTEIYKSFVDDEDMLAAVVEARPRAVSLHFGLPPAHYIAALKEAGCVLLATATTLEEAKKIEQAGIDIIVAQGYEAGGHRGTFHPERGDSSLGTFALVQLLARHTKLPIVAAGGIMDGQGIAAAMALGADAVQLGTAFILCPESSANAGYRALLKGPAAHQTAVTAVISGRAARGLPNRQFSDVGAATHPAIPDYPIAYDAAKKLHAAALQRGNLEFSVNWAGQGAPLAREMPAAELVKVLMQELAVARGKIIA